MTTDFRGITFKPVTRDNWLKLIKLDIFPEQYEYLAKNAGLYVIAYSAMYPDWKNFAVYHKEDLIGYFNCQYQEYPNVATSMIKFLFIDREYQSQGYGLATIERITEQIRSIYPMAQEIRIQVNPDNKAAKHILEKLGYYSSCKVGAAGKQLYCYSIVK